MLVDLPYTPVAESTALRKSVSQAPEGSTRTRQRGARRLPWDPSNRCSTALHRAALAKKQAAPAESNEANLYLSLGLKSHEGDRETDLKLKEQNEGG
ncbi:hypothetical protein QJS10_CPA05g01799 [Acorus calamus]|uniref:Uncharacterized protein n=1 Tax=Acorus calamus TaxID=4465 RepID=A0AAV9ES26_ACOCL|nr:hypothetical protein QJS10_CPA05g01799 [Acorus calamus]